MDTKYIYNSNKIKAMEDSLLSDSQLERMLSAKSVSQAFASLNDTFLSPYISTEEKTHLPSALRMAMIDTKKEIAFIAPEPELLKVMWLRYDFHNLKTIIKGLRVGLPDEEIVNRCYNIGSIDPSELFKIVKDENFNILDISIGDAYFKAKKTSQVYEIDIEMHRGYFSAIKRIATAQNNMFLKRFVVLLIDLFNLKTGLRMLNNRNIDGGFFIDGGSLHKDDTETRNSIFEALADICGGVGLWKDAKQEYEKNRSFAVIEKTSDDYLVSFLKNESRDMFSIATQFAFFIARRNNVQVIKTIMTAKETGMNESELRVVLRRLYS